METVEELKIRLAVRVEKLNSLISEDWVTRLLPFISSKRFDKISLYIRDRKAAGVNVYPDMDKVFRAYNLCSFDNIKVVIAAQDAYYQKGVADGLAFSCSLTGVEQPSLLQFNNEIQRTVKDAAPRTCDLSYLAKQGVLLINRSLTVEQDKAGSHMGIWDDFHSYVFQVLLKKEDPIVYVLLGKESQNFFAKFRRRQDHIINVTHPAYAVRQGIDWNCNDLFNKTNKFLEINGIGQIKW